ncbi:D-ala-D-ala transporter subunit [Bacillus sp. FJAT-27264]|uniref:ABC transporter permease n=1 Tax=Paenibacillus agri TaxID=2744309 RepID=A0A850EWK7_9BACL|nr:MULTISPECIES: ABC transporter permease [Bacillales]NUU63847.1 ABC transporter permease [Paenibacillus agri]OBZ12002.1 D-ala-D-ala transporter subunit [Bacillus sp. FJAT-27264]
MNSNSLPAPLPPVIEETSAGRAYKLKEFILFLRVHKLAAIGLSIIVILLIIAVIGPLISPYPDDAYKAVHLENKLLPPSWAHLFGTDELGRDLLTRTIYGTRLSFQIGISVILLSILIGIPYGLISGYFGGWVDNVMMRVCEVFLSFPSMLLSISIVALLGPSLNNMMLSIALSWWPWFARLMRSEAVAIKERGFVEAAKSMGVHPLVIIFRHIWPNSLSVIIVQISMAFGSVILTAASLSFLGLGAQPPTPEWGLIISTGRAYFLTNWWYVTFPGVFILLTVMAFNFLGDGLRDYLDPKTRNS